MYWSGRTSWSYDARGRVVTETQAIGALGTYTTTYSYNSQDQVVTTTYPDSEVVTTSYNIAGQPAALTSSLGTSYVTEATYNPAGQLKSRRLGSTPARTTWWGYFGYSEADGTGDSFDDIRPGYPVYGALFRLCTGQDQAADCPPPPAGSAGAVQDLRYWYDAVGNVTAIRDYPNSNQVQQFRYDELNRLTDAWTEPAGVGAGAYITRTYAYNSIGNIATFEGVTYGYGQPSGIAPGAKPHAVTHVGGTPRYWYNANGNTITRTVGSATDSLTYDAENQLHSVTNTATGETVSFTYDGDGRRVLRDTATDITLYVGPNYEVRFEKGSLPQDRDGDCVVSVIDIMQVVATWDGQNLAEIQDVANHWRDTCPPETTKYYSLGGRPVAGALGRPSPPPTQNTSRTRRCGAHCRGCGGRQHQSRFLPCREAGGLASRPRRGSAPPSHGSVPLIYAPPKK